MSQSLPNVTRSAPTTSWSYLFVVRGIVGRLTSKMGMPIDKKPHKVFFTICPILFTIQGLVSRRSPLWKFLGLFSIPKTPSCSCRRQIFLLMKRKNFFVKNLVHTSQIAWLMKDWKGTIFDTFKFYKEICKRHICGQSY